MPTVGLRYLTRLLCCVDNRSRMRQAKHQITSSVIPMKRIDREKPHIYWSPPIQSLLVSNLKSLVNGLPS